MNQQEQRAADRRARHQKRRKQRRHMDTATVTVRVAQCINLAGDNKLAQTQFEGVSANYAIGKAAAAAAEVAETYQKQRRKLLHEYGQVDEDTGELKTTPDGSLVFKQPRLRRELEDKTQELLDERVELSIPRIKLSELRTSTPTPEIFRTLAPFITED
jgi:hypothetical protein